MKDWNICVEACPSYIMLLDFQNANNNIDFEVARP